MNRALIACVTAATLAAPLGVLGAQRTFVSAAGADGQPCSLSLPCRSFAAAIAQTNPGGEVIVLDAGGYGAVTVDKAVSIVAPAGIYAGISVFSGAGIAIAAGNNDTVTLRGLSINAQGGTRGVAFTAGGKLVVERCTITGNFSQAIAIGGPMTPTVLIKEVEIADAQTGVDVSGPGGELVRLTVADTVLSRVSTGLHVVAGADIAIDGARFVGTGTSIGAGIDLQTAAGHTPIDAHIANSFVARFGDGANASATGGPIALSIAATELSRNGVAIASTPNATVALAGNRIVHNAGGTFATGGVVYTSGTNYVVDNGNGNAVTGPQGSF